MKEKQENTTTKPIVKMGLKNIINNFKDQRIAVIGDLILDVYLWGDASRISQEAPVPVMQVNKRTERLGGAANVMCNITTLGSKALAFGVTGADKNGQRLTKLLNDYDIDSSAVLQDRKRITTEKQRIIAASQQLLRIDHEDLHYIDDKLTREIVNTLKKEIKSKNIDAIIFEDYAKGMLGSEMAEEITKAAIDANIVISLDPHPGHPLNISDITVMTPNKSEAFGLAGIYQSNNSDDAKEIEQLEQVAKRIADKWNPQYLLITLGAKGMALFERDKTPIIIPTRAREVFDVSGAGDTVIATFTLALLSGATGIEAAEIANHAAGVVVGKVGTVSVTSQELLDSF